MKASTWTATALALITAVGAGCGSSPGSDGGGSASGATERPAPSREQAVKFAECLRQNGVSDYPDPDASGETSYGVSVPVSVWTSAVRACKDLQPPGALSAEMTPEEQDDALLFAECVRGNGIKDFPDPVDGEPLINTYEIPSSNEPGGMTILNAAIEKCGDLLGAAAGSR